MKYHAEMSAAIERDCRTSFEPLTSIAARYGVPRKAPI
jgi:hypothetical protein